MTENDKTFKILPNRKPLRAISYCVAITFFLSNLGIIFLRSLGIRVVSAIFLPIAQIGAVGLYAWWSRYAKILHSKAPAKANKTENQK